MSFPRYPKYKDSGVEWLSDVPEHWVPKKIGAISSLKGRLGWQGLKADEYREQGPHVVSSAHFEDHVIQWDECPRVSQKRYDTDNNIQLAVNDVLLMKDGAAMGKLAFVDSLPGPACLNSHLLLFRPVKIDGAEAYFPRFAFYFMQTGYFQEHIKVNGTGATFLGISQEAIARYQLILPPLVEQTCIAEFLDRETGKIDELVAEQQRLMELLKEKRQAVISHAVTKGLNPRAPMKPSNIEWLGDVPEHWKCMPLKHLCQVLKDGTHLPPARVDQGIPLLSVRNLIDGEFSLRDDDSLITEESYRELCRAFVPQPGDVLLAIVGATLGKTAVVPEGIGRFHIQRSVALFRTTKDVIRPGYLKLILESNPFQGLLWQLVGYSAQPGIYLGDLRNICMPLPPPDEQDRALDLIGLAADDLKHLAAEAQKAIDLLQERRTALISAAVTGQIDVRKLAAA